MLDLVLSGAALLTTALLFGGMLLFAAGFAAFAFKALPLPDARALIRKAFPPFYLFVMLTAGAAALLSWPRDPLSALGLASIALTTVPARQLLMPAINRATDLGLKARFARLHGLSVLITLVHIVVAAVIVLRLAR
ncbi:MAG: DUF4149 domain-containing protein [Betaproteobacteria bacterium]|jgi:hypothetical protein|nr:DUF4149 domain-containing protein [Rhodocyclaceae bacterium]MCA3135520.1 DUF4149 domain-containing protein [Rhodocyclaceae bacterium]MCA3143854.1 DUF4149 domain-containing protein [Rhodocyclaceae bacterium]MCA3146110.1 DUF4149 domain-containing protein [Rhodocyclaceae bacterium]MCE2897028.1 DUF4149 domain-containing protein [Betaproteobacteria bacterium]